VTDGCVEKAAFKIVTWQWRIGDLSDRFTIDDHYLGDG
jgi:hypothetical protein